MHGSLSIRLLSLYSGDQMAVVHVYVFPYTVYHVNGQRCTLKINCLNNTTTIHICSIYIYTWYGDDICCLLVRMCVQYVCLLKCRF